MPYANTRKRIITGRKQPGEGRFRGAPEACRDLFVYRVHPETMSADINVLINGAGYDVRNIDCISHQNAKYSSFRLTVSASDFENVCTVMTSRGPKECE